MTAAPVFPLTLSLDDIDLFARASHDVNPLHMSSEYARRTPFGARVVHGMLAAVACIGRLKDRRHERIVQASFEFKGAVSASTPYSVALQEADGKATIRLLDGHRLLLKATLAFAAGAPSRSLPRAVPPSRSSAPRRTLDELTPPWAVHGEYGPASEPLEQLLRRFNVRAECGFGPVEITALLASSYLVGMEAPGESALFSRAAVRFHAPGGETTPTLTYRLEVTDGDPRFDLLRTTAAFEMGDVRVADADLEAFLRPSATDVDVTVLRALSAPGSSLAGKSAIVVGGSRGLGAAITMALADQGCRVGLSFAKSRDAAERVAALAPPGTVELLQVDAEDASEFPSVAEAFMDRCGGLDILVCNASPSLTPLSFDSASAARLVDYVSRSVAMAAVPLSSTIGPLGASGGHLVLISSAAVTHPPREWPHYVTAKRALEALADVALATAPNLHTCVVRPPMLRTDFVSTLGTTSEAMAPELVAARIVEQLLRSASAHAALIDSF